MKRLVLNTVLFGLVLLLPASASHDLHATWLTATEIGQPINSEGDEKHPCYSPGGDTIFFNAI